MDFKDYKNLFIVIFFFLVVIVLFYVLISYSQILLSSNDLIYDEYNIYENISDPNSINSHYTTNNKSNDWFRQILNISTFWKSIIVFGFILFILFSVLISRKLGILRKIHNETDWIYKK